MAERSALIIHDRMRTKSKTHIPIYSVDVYARDRQFCVFCYFLLLLLFVNNVYKVTFHSYLLSDIIIDIQIQRTTQKRRRRNLFVFFLLHLRCVYIAWNCKCIAAESHVCYEMHFCVSLSLLQSDHWQFVCHCFFSSSITMQCSWC